MHLTLVGLRSSGKTTLFNAVTGAHAAVGGYSAAANIGQVKVPDERLEVLARIEGSKKITHAVIDFRDLAGLGVSSGGEAKGNANILSEMRDAEGLVLVVRAFENDNVAHPCGSIDVERDVRTLLDDLVLADTLIVHKRMERLKVDATKPKPRVERERIERELGVLARCCEVLEEGGTLRGLKMAEGERELIEGFSFLTEKPSLVVVNVGEGEIGKEVSVGVGLPVLAACAEIEAELASMEGEERASWAAEYGVEVPVSARLAELSYRTLDVMTFLTVGPTEARAWTVRRGTTAVEAAGKVHTDMARGFVRAETTAYADLETCGDFKEARARGKTRLEGREYVVQEGDVILFRHNA